MSVDDPARQPDRTRSWPIDSAHKAEVLRSAANHIPDGLIIADAKGQLVFFNPAAERILGIGFLDVEPSEWSRAYGCFLPDGTTPYPPEQLPLARAIRGEDVLSEEFVVRNPQRPDSVTIRVSGRPMRDGSGRVTGGIVLFRDVTSFRNSEANVKRLTGAMEQIADSVLITDIKGTIVYVNAAFERRTGFSRAEAIGRSPRLIKSGKHPASFYERLWKTLLAGQEFRGTIINRRKSGELFWAEQIITPIRETDGEITHFVSVLRDVTRRETELKHERDFNAAIVSTAGALVFVTDFQGRVVRFNPACEFTTGFAAEDVLGHDLFELPFVTDTRGAWDDLLRQIRAGRTPVEGEAGWTARGGGCRIIDWTLKGLRDGDGQVTYIVGSGIDVTEQRSTQAALAESETKYRTLVENLNEGLWLIDEHGVTSFVNARMAEMLGYDVAEMEGRHLFTFMDDQGKEFCKRNIERRKRGITEDHEFELLRKDGERVHTIMQSSPIMDAAGRYRGTLAGVLDITARKRAEKALQQAHDELEQRVDERTRELREALDEVRRLKDQLEAENVVLREEVDRTRPSSEIIGSSPALLRALKLVDQVAGTDSAVLLLGETGTGKGLFARAIHRRSQLRARPLVTVDCTALPPTLIESELFGHEKGAFTGATRTRPGRFELADGGTIFLDEIGDMPLELQTKLLRVLQSGEFEPVGSDKTRQVNVRVIAATNRDLEQMVAEGSFRSDLYFRLSVFPIPIPPLRDRPRDILPLVRHFIECKKVSLRHRITDVPDQVVQKLQNHGWPGNVRELENIVERALIISSGPMLELDESLSVVTRAQEAPAEQAEESLAGREYAHIVEVLERCGWRIKGAGNAAERLGVAPSTLRDRMRKLGIRRPGA